MINNAARIRRIIPDPIEGLPVNDQSSFWSVIVPEATTNLVRNPSLEANTTDWTFTQDGASTFTRSTARSFTGAYSGKLTFSGGTYCVVYLNLSLSPSTTYTFSFRIFREANAGVHIQIDEYNVTPTLLISTTKTIRGAANDWVYETITVRTQSTISYAIFAFWMDTAGTCYIDSVQVEQKSYPTTYCDGDQEGCYWTGIPHGSTSSRYANDRRGGRVWNFRDFKFTVTATIGASALAYTTLGTPYALVGGGFYQRSVSPIKAFSIAGAFECNSLIDLKHHRMELYETLKPDLTSPQTPVRLLYSPRQCNNDSQTGYAGNSRTLAVDAVYTGGLEGNEGGWPSEKVALGFNIYTPYISSAVVDNVASLSLSSTLTSYHILRRDLVSGTWVSIGGSSTNGTIKAMVVGTDGQLYAGGSFTTIGGVSAAHIAVWNGTGWLPLGAGVDDNVEDLLIGADGNLYVIGQFLNAGAGAANRIAQWNVTTLVWSALGTGLNGNGYALALGNDGAIYAGGVFTTAGGGAAAAIAKWNGSSWSQLSSGITGGSATVYDLITMGFRNRTMIVMGAFTTAGGTARPNVARWETEGLAWASLGSGLDNTVYKGVVGEDGRAWVGGLFLNTGSTSMPYMAAWNGEAWQDTNGQHLDSNPLVVARGKPGGGSILVGGYFTLAGSLSVSGGFAEWNGTTWIQPDVNLGVAEIPTAILWTPQYEYLATDGSTSIKVAGITTVTTTSRADVRPVVTFTGPGTLTVLRNHTTGDLIQFAITLLSGEVATMALAPAGIPGAIMTSNIRGDISYAIQPGSQLATWRLVPGANQISFLMTGTTGASAASLRWRDTYTALDAAVR